jgi:GT2 family glycosyltransferase
MVPAPDATVAAIIPLGPGRLDNLVLVAEALGAQTRRPNVKVVICDGHEAHLSEKERKRIAALLGGFSIFIEAPKFERGYQMTRNIGVKFLHDAGMETDFLWFVDSDILMSPTALEHLMDTALSSPTGIVAAPYEWLPPGVRVPTPGLRNSPIWQGVAAYGFGPHKHSRRAALLNLSGNLLYNWNDFWRIGGFHSELKRGEDGELGLRAACYGIPTTFDLKARGYHLHHPVDAAAVLRATDIDYPKIQAWHPWANEGQPDDACMTVEPGISWVSSSTGNEVHNERAWDEVPCGEIQWYFEQGG